MSHVQKIGLSPGVNRTIGNQGSSSTIMDVAMRIGAKMKIHRFASRRFHCSRIEMMVANTIIWYISTLQACNKFGDN